MPNEVYESKEFDRLVGRGFRDYSVGHQRMYTTAIERIKADHEGPVNIFEAGFGIGFGISKMLEANIINQYAGVEPNKKAYEHVALRNTYPSGHQGMGMANDPRFMLANCEFNQAFADDLSRMAMYDEAFCIEVIEHVPMHLHLQFLIALRQMAPRLWFSSPDKKKSREGVRTTAEWTTLLRQANFKTVTVDQSNWTYLYECR